ncbi:unnamed protein product [Cochlearia groenlandica]
MSDDKFPPPENQIPTLKLEGIQVYSALGRGSKGVVFLVRSDNISNKHHLALKVIQRESSVSFEQRLLSGFDHPLFPRLYGVLSTDKVIGYAIDYCPGRDLNSLRNKQSERMFSDDIIRFYGAEIVIAIEYLHSKGIVYRDLKPDNVMIQENGHLMLVDFDLSTNLPPPQPSPPSPPSPSTKNERLFPFSWLCNSGISPYDSVSTAAAEFESPPQKSNSFVGTEEYVAPEVIAGNGHDFAVDWWSLGIVLHEMLYGTTPFRGLNRKETFSKILNETPRLVGDTTPLRDLIRKLLKKDHSRRINVEGIKGHDFFKGLDWELLLNVSRPPYLPPPEIHEVSKIDVEKYVHDVFDNYDNNHSLNIKGKDGINKKSVDNCNFLVF